MMVYPDTPVVRKFLTLKYREMVKANGKTTFSNLTAPMYEPTVTADGKHGLSSYQGFWRSLKEHLEELGNAVTVIDNRPSFPEPNFAQALLGLRPFQKGWIIRALQDGNSGLIGAPTRFGKCMSPETEVLMFDGSLKEVRDIKEGDLVMGPDSKPRTVASVCSGRDQMYRVVPNKGDAWVCTQDHILSLQCTGGANFDGYKSGDIVNITVTDYLKKSATFKHCFKQYQAAVEFDSSPVPHDPYVVGTWLGDGRHLRRHPAWRHNPALTIPREYLANDRETRLQVLAGLLDTDGHLVRGKAIEISSKYDQLAKDIAFLGRSLGFRVTSRLKKSTIKSSGFEGWYHRLFICGDLGSIPFKRADKWSDIESKPKVDPLRTGFKVEAIGEGDYAGFTLVEEDARFVLGNFAVTHNSYGMTALCRAFPNSKTVVVAPGVSLCEQLYDHFVETLPHRDVRGVYTGSRNKHQGPDITVCSMDSMDKMDPDDTDLLIIDEPHAVVADERLPKLAAFTKSRKYGFGATLTGRFDKKDRLIEGLIGPVITNVTYKEAVGLGAISPLKVIMVKIPFSKDVIPGARVERQTVYKRLLTQSAKTARLVKKIIDEVVPSDWQTMAFIMDEKQADFYMQEAFPPHGTIAMAKKMSPKERKDVTNRIATGELVRVLASNIYVQGITFPDLKVVINLAGGGANTTAIQKPGRLLQVRPGKNYGVMIDFVFECVDSAQEDRKNPPYMGIVGESWARHKAYADIGYDIEFVSSAEQAAEIVRRSYGDHEPLPAKIEPPPPEPAANKAQNLMSLLFGQSDNDPPW